MRSTASIASHSKNLFLLQTSTAYQYQISAINWVKSADAPSGDLRYQFRYGVNGGTQYVFASGAKNVATLSPIPGTIAVSVFIINPGTPASAAGDQPNGYR